MPMCCLLRRCHAGFVFSGLGPDYRVLVRKSRKRAQSYHLMYRVRPTLVLVTRPRRFRRRRGVEWVASPRS